MPFKSKKQWRWMFKNKPKTARRWAKHTKIPYRKLPERKGVKRR